MSFFKGAVDFLPNIIKNRQESREIKSVRSMNITNIKPGQGITGRIEDQFVAVYNDDGNYIVLRNVCKHLGCQTNWNIEEKTWDCPCHGSRYTADGGHLRGPARRPLEKLGFYIENEQIHLRKAA